MSDGLEEFCTDLRGLLAEKGCAGLRVIVAKQTPAADRVNGGMTHG